MTHKLESESLMIIEAVTEWSITKQPTEENMEGLINLVGDLLEDVIKRHE